MVYFKVISFCCILCLNKATKKLVSLAYLCVDIEEIDVTNCLVIFGVQNFYVLLTVHLSIILDNDQLDTHLLYFTIRFL